MSNSKRPGRPAAVAVAAAALLWTPGCGPDGGDDAPAVSQVVTLEGFDKDHEPLLRTLEDGTLELRFARLPPGRDSGEDAPMGAYSEIDRDLQEAIGVPVEWPERELLRVREPADDTADRVAAFVKSYRP